VVGNRETIPLLRQKKGQGTCRRNRVAIPLKANIFATYNRARHALCVPDKKKFPKIRKSEASLLLGSEIAHATTLRT
jgi:hypothetical protein